MYTIYVAICDVNGKAYVGQTKHPLDVRRSQHERKSRALASTGAFSSALRAYGVTSFTWYEIDYAESVEQANTKERFYIRYLNSVAPFGYNLDSGGENKVTHEDTRRKMAEARNRQESGPNKGRKFTEEWRKNIAAGQTGKTVTKETREKISKSLKGRKVSEETLERMMESKPNRRAVVLQHEETQEIRAFRSQGEASRSLRVSTASVSLLVNGRVESVRGWTVFKVDK